MVFAIFRTLIGSRAVYRSREDPYAGLTSVTLVELQRQFSAPISNVCYTLIFVATRCNRAVFWICYTRRFSLQQHGFQAQSTAVLINKHGARTLAAKNEN